MNALSTSDITVRLATVDDHKALVKIARRTRFTSDFTAPRYSSPEVYAKGWIAVAVNPAGTILGFVAVRNRKRDWTSLYFLGVRPHAKRAGVGRALARWAAEQSPHGRVRLKVDAFNPDALAFWKSVGYEVVHEPGHGDNGLFWEMELNA